MMKRHPVSLLLSIAIILPSCSKVQDTMQGINPRHVATQFLEAWKKKDWRALYKLAHPDFIRKIRLQKLLPEQRKMSDEELFIREFEQAQRMYPGKILRNYEIKSISEYRRGETTVWVRALVNGKHKKIPLTLDGLSLKIDLSQIE